MLSWAKAVSALRLGSSPHLVPGTTVYVVPRLLHLVRSRFCTNIDNTVQWVYEARISRNYQALFPRCGMGLTPRPCPGFMGLLLEIYCESCTTFNSLSSILKSSLLCNLIIHKRVLRQITVIHDGRTTSPEGDPVALAHCRS